MKNLKKALRLIGLIMLIALACMGVGIIGGAPIPEKRRRENVIELRSEIKKEEEDEEDTISFYNRE